MAWKPSLSFSANQNLSGLLVLHEGWVEGRTLPSAPQKIRLDRNLPPARREGEGGREGPRQ